jgi:hypothetical protein
MVFKRKYTLVLLNIRKKDLEQLYIAQKLYHQQSPNNENIHRLLKQMMLFYLMTRTILMGKWVHFFDQIGSVLLAQNHVPLIFQFQS